MELAGTRVAVLAEDLYEELELWYPYYRFVEAGADVTIVGSGRVEEFASKRGYPVKADVSVHDADVSTFDAVIIPGGYSPDWMRRTPEMVTFVREAHDQGKVVAAICHGPWMLASARIIDGRRVTSYMSLRDDLEAVGGVYVDEAVTVDGNIITSRWPPDLPDFCRAIVEQVAAAKNAAAV